MGMVRVLCIGGDTNRLDEVDAVVVVVVAVVDSAVQDESGEGE